MRLVDDHRIPFLKWLEKDESSRKFISRSVPSATGNEALFNQLIKMGYLEGFHAWVGTSSQGSIIAYAEAKITGKTHKNELELIYVVAEVERGNGVASQLINDIISNNIWLLEKKLVAFINPENIASIVVLQKNNFRLGPTDFEGIKYELTTWKDSNISLPISFCAS